jgi:hypothetical protein
VRDVAHLQPVDVGVRHPRCSSPAVVRQSHPNPPHEQGLVRLDVRTLSPLSSLPRVVVEHSANDPPHEQWLAGLDVGAEAESFMGLILVVSVLTLV